MQNNTLRGLVFAMAVVIVLMGGIIASQHSDLSKPVPSELPPCDFGMIISWDGGGNHPGYWVELTDGDMRKECIIRADNRSVVVQM